VEIVLRGILKEVEEYCGRAVAIEMMEKLGGMELKIPSKITPDNPLSLMSRENAQSVIDNFVPGENFYVPQGRLSNYEMAREMLARDALSRDICLTFGVSERTVRNWRNRYKDERRSKAKIKTNAPLTGAGRP